MILVICEVNGRRLKGRNRGRASALEDSGKTASGKRMRMAGILVGGFTPAGCHSLLGYSNDLVLLDSSGCIDGYDIAEF